ncbi:hypothetical protein GGI15_001175 [Coemansia interrupta]|uniref:Uncharacterized protein n=1 Tax=Coemansia interrupta TaxID=1126814 RepID=A0A9W8HKA1_9FUNG|nr:hypothetical protein GGI15_001175 [Coemansia interrupta]
MLRRAVRIQLPRLRGPAAAPTTRLLHTTAQIPASGDPNAPRFPERPSDHDAEEAPPHVSSYAVGATVFLIGGLSYYLYSEYGHVVTDHLPFGARSRLSDSLSEADRRAKEETRRQRRLRAAMVPKSAMTAAEQVNWAWTHPGLYVTGSNLHGLIDPLHPGSGSGLKAAVAGFEGKVLRSAAFATTHAAAVDTDGNVFQWGTGFVGADSPHRPVSTMRDSTIRTLAASNDYIALLDTKSRVRLLPGSAAATTSNDPVSLPFEPRLGWRESVVSLSAGEDHLAVTTTAGNVYTCSLADRGNDRFQLGHGESGTDVKPFVLKRVASDRKFSSAVCGGRHTLLLADDGNVYGCGANDFGQLAMGSYSEGTTTIRDLVPLRKLWKNGYFEPATARAELLAAGAATSYIQIRQGNDLNNKLGQCIPDRRHRLAEPTHPLPLYRSLLEPKQSEDPDFAPRLQAAPRQWVHESSFAQPSNEASTKSTSRSGSKVLVEQAFVAGPEVTAAYLRQV